MAGELGQKPAKDSAAGTLLAAAQISWFQWLQHTQISFACSLWLMTACTVNPSAVMPTKCL